MGLLRAGIGALKAVLADQWRDYFYCDAMDADTLAVRADKRIAKKSRNKKGERNVITEGSIVAVNQGQCMIIVDNGRISEVCAEPGEFVYESSSQPSIFYGDLEEKIAQSLAEVEKRIAFGGQAATDQRVYYINTKEITGNKYGTVNPIPFRVVDRNIGLDVDISIRCHGDYSYRISDPVLFFANVCGNVSDAYMRSEIDTQLRSELMTAMQPAFARISEQGIRYSSLPLHTKELAQTLNEELSAKWRNMRGIEIISFGVSTVKASEEDERMIKELQKAAALQNPSLAAGELTSAQADAMRNASKNSGGAMNGFVGMNMAQGMGGVNAADLYNMAQTHKQPISGGANKWTCKCGAANSGKFCSECGSPKPESWTCSCGATNSGKFCSNCGKAR